MTDQEYNHTKKRLQSLIKKWYHAGGWGWWRTEFTYSNERQPGNDGVAAETHADPKYSHATITFYMPVLSGLSDEELEATFVHELCHLTASMYPSFEDNHDAMMRFERTVDDFARHIIWAVENVKTEVVRAAPKPKKQAKGKRVWP
jgi:hypothetical protein